MTTRILAPIYIAVAIFTFGHAINNPVIPNKHKACAPLAAFLWPFYWSWELQRKAQP